MPLTHRGTVLSLIVMASMLTGCGKQTGQPIIALLIDGEHGQAVAAQLEGSIYGTDPQARVTYLLRLPAEGDTRQMAYAIDQAVLHFPAGSIFAIATENLSHHSLILVKTGEKKFYLAPDNGLLSYVVAREGMGKAWQLDNGLPSKEAIDYLGTMAGLLAESRKPEILEGKEIKSIEMLPVNPPHTSGRTISGEIVHVEADGSLITNIPEKLASWMKEGNLLRLTIGKESFSAPLVTALSEVQPGKYATLYDGQGRLQIVRNKGSAAQELKVGVGDGVLIRP